jgi:predicted DNA-binding protein (UPF0251 family)
MSISTSTMKINDRKLITLIDKEKKSQSQAAKELGVSRQAVSKRLIELRGKTTKVITAKRAEKVINQKLDTIAQLVKINKQANDLLDQIEDDDGLKLKAMAEIRNQLKLQFEIYQTLYSLKAAQEFQEAVLEAIAEVEPDVRNRIIQKLNEKRAVRSAVGFS